MIEKRKGYAVRDKISLPERNFVPPTPSKNPPLSRAKRESIIRKLVSHVPQRLLGFSLVGGCVMIAGMVLLFLLIQVLHIEKNLAYLIQAIVSIETNFFLNRFLNWKERDGQITVQWLKFHTTAALTFPVNQVLFAILTWMGVHYLLVMLIGVGLSTTVNYVANDRFVFHLQEISTRNTELVRVVSPLTQLPHVGVVIPMRDSQQTIRQCLESVLRQQYRGRIDIFLVGNSPHHDASWSVLDDFKPYPYVHVLYVEQPKHIIGRDANMKRYAGAQAALQVGVDVVALLDSKVEAPIDWIEKAVKLLHEQDVDALAGKSCRQPDDQSLVSIYQDKSLFSEWPRYGTGFLLRKHNFGQTQCLPITANMFFTRNALLSSQNIFPSPANDTGWDDFQIARNLIRQGAAIFCTDQLRVYRNHQRKFRLFKQVSSGMGGMNFYRDHPDCSYARRRLAQMLLVLGCCLAIAIAALLLVSIDDKVLWNLTGIVSITFILLYSSISCWKARDIRGLLFLPLDVLHIGLWVAGAIYALFHGGSVRPEVAKVFVRLR